MQLREEETAWRGTRKLQETNEHGEQGNIGAATASAAAEEVVRRKIIDLKRADHKLSQVKFEAKAKDIEDVEANLYVPKQGALIMFDPLT